MQVGSLTSYSEKHSPSRRKATTAKAAPQKTTRSRKPGKHERVMRLAKSVELYEYRDKIMSALRERTYIPAFGYCAMAMMQWVGTMCRERQMSFDQVQQTAEYRAYQEMRDLLEQL